MKENKNILSLATKKSEERIRVEFNDGQIAQMKTELSENCIKNDDVDKERKDIMAEYKEKLDALKKTRKQLLKNIRYGFEDQNMMVHNIPNEENLTIEFYDEDGVKVGERRMTIDEKPSIMFPISKAE